MSAITQNIELINIHSEIQHHPAWLGSIVGLKAEKMLRNRKQSYLYVLRAGEAEGNYYVTFLDSNLTVRHQPFVITVSEDGWSYENYIAGGMYTGSTSINDVLHLIMHCEKEQCMPLINFQ